MTQNQPERPNDTGDTADTADRADAIDSDAAPSGVATDTLPAASTDAAAPGESIEPAGDVGSVVDGESPDAPAGASGASASVDLEREGEIAADYLEELLDIADLDGDIDMDVERDRALVSVVGDDLGDLVGRDGAVLEALQELTRLAVLTATGRRSRLMLDVGGYRAGRRAVLSELGRTTAETVRESGQKARLVAMTPFERKIVHDAVAVAGLRSESEGEEPHRCVVVLPA